MIYKAGLSPEEVKKNYKLKRIIKLASNENNWGLPLKVIIRLASVLRESHRYPDNSYSELKEKIAKRYGISCNRVLLGNGSDEIIDILINRLTEPDDEIIFPTPSFQLYKILVKNHRRKGVEIPLVDWQYDIKKFLKTVNKKTRLLILCNPNNPTGTAVYRSDLLYLLSNLPSHVKVIIDEAYADFTTSKDFCSGIELLDEFPNLIVTRTFSKFFCFAGMRLGYAFASEKISKIYNFFKMPFSINRIAASAYILFEYQRYFDSLKLKILKEKERFYSKMQNMNVKFVKSETNFVFLPEIKNAKRVFEELLKKGIIVRELSNFGIKSGLRITIGKPRENSLFFKEFKRVINHEG